MKHETDSMREVQSLLQQLTAATPQVEANCYSVSEMAANCGVSPDRIRKILANAKRHGRLEAVSCSIVTLNGRRGGTTKYRILPAKPEGKKVRKRT